VLPERGQCLRCGEHCGGCQPGRSRDPGKIRFIACETSVALFWFGLRDVGILYSQAVIQRPIVDFPAFFEAGSAEKITVCDHTTRDPNK
jgi:hypothetical protein